MPRKSRETFKDKESKKRKDIVDESSEMEVQISKKLQAVINDRMNFLQNENTEEIEPQNSLLLPVTKGKISLKKKKLPEEDFIEPNLNRLLPMGESKRLAEMTREEKLNRNHFDIFLRKRLPKLREECPGLRGYRAVQIVTKEWLKL